MTSELQNVYTGSIVEANYLIELLEENKISCILRDTLNESVIAGWGSGSPEDSAIIQVETAHAENAKKIIEEYFSKR
jgi:hypothetical protein